MTIKLNSDKLKLQNFEEKREAFVNMVKENADKEEQDKAYIDMVNAMAEDIKSAAEQAAEDAANDKFNELNAYSKQGLSAEEIKFFNEIDTEVGYKEEKLLPQTTIDRIFDDMVKARPLLQEINLRSAGLRLKFLTSETNGVAVWGKIFSEIKGQLDAAFGDEETIQHKLTAFVVVPKDLEPYGPVWIERFVRLQITEAFSAALEAALVAGDGKDKPIGLIRNVKKDVAIVDGVYPEKEPEGTLTFATPEATVRELTAMMKYLSTKENGVSINISGNVVLVVNPSQAWEVRAQYTHLNANGVYVTAMPYNLRVVESEFLAAGKAIGFVTNRYDAYVGGGIDIKKYDQTLALEDLDLHIAKQFAYGKARDNKAAVLYNLDVPALPGTDSEPEGA